MMSAASADSAHTTPTEDEQKKETAAPADAPPNGCENTPLRSQARRDSGVLGTPAQKKEEKDVIRTTANCEKVRVEGGPVRSKVSSKFSKEDEEGGREAASAYVRIRMLTYADVC